ncbi:hypothetical protein [Glycomyces tenuis]|uniref:hypothetical protein n=1 Tax=Glycomyces tenuis TaxID=58116 RepID=UPI00047D4576|nr:hypothetical protein [Glycomyces tenuis]
MRPGEIRVRLDTKTPRTVVVLSSETFNLMTKRVLVAPLMATDQVLAGVPAEGGFIGFQMIHSVLVSALSEPRGHVGDEAVDEAHSLVAGAMTR